VVANSAKVGYLESLVSANSSVAANTAKTGFTDALVALAPTVAANTAKTGFTQAAVTANTAVQANSAKTGFTEALVDTTPSVVANTAKITFATADSTQVTANKDDITQNQNDIADNVTDISGLDTVVNTTHANLHTSHTSSLATKASLSSHQTYTGRQQFGDGSASVDGRLTIHSNDSGANTLLIMDSRKQADSCAIYFRHAGGNKFTIGLNADSDLVIKNMATGVDQIVLPIGGGILLPNLPTDDPLVAGQLWVNNANKIVVSQG
jgi:hypothetical protein